MNLKSTIAVLLLAAALGAYLYVVEIGPKDSPDDASTAETGEPLFEKDAVAAEKVTRVRVELPGVPGGPGAAKSATFERATASDPWRQTEPVAFDATGWAVDRVIDLTSGLRYTSTFAPKDKQLTPEQLGLAPPRAIVTLAGGEGFEPVTVAIGRAPAAGVAYAVVGYESGKAIDRVHVVGDELHKDLGADAIDRMRSKSLAAVTPGAADQVTLTRDGKTIKLVKREGSWSIVEPVSDRAGREGVERLIGAFAAAGIEQFTADKPADLSAYGLDKPSRTLTVHATRGGASAENEGEPAKEPATHTLVIGNPTGLNAESYYAMTGGGDVVFTISKAAAERLDAELDTLRDPRLATAVVADVTGLTIKHADGSTVAFVRDQGVWKFGEPAPAFALDGELLNAAIDALIEARADAFDAVADDAPAPRATVELSTIGRTEPITLTVRDAGEGKLAVALGGEKTARVIERAAVEQLLSPATAYRDRTIIAATTDQVAKVHVKRTGTWPAEYTIDRAPPKAEGPSPDGEAAATAEPWRLDGLDRAAAMTLVGMIAPLRAERWLDGPLPDDAKDRAVIDVTFIDGTSKRLTIDYTNGHGMVDGIDTAFALSEGDAEPFAAELADRLVLKLSVDDIASIAGAGWTVKRSVEGRFTLDAPGIPGSAKLDEQAAAGLFDAAANLSAEHFMPAAPDGAAAATLTLTTHDGKAHTIAVYPAAGEGDAMTPTMLKVDDRVFTVSPAVAKRLSAKPVVVSK